MKSILLAMAAGAAILSGASAQITNNGMWTVTVNPFNPGAPTTVVNRFAVPSGATNGSLAGATAAIVNPTGPLMRGIGAIRGFVASGPTLVAQSSMYNTAISSRTDVFRNAGVGTASIVVTGTTSSSRSVTSSPTASPTGRVDSLVRVRLPELLGVDLDTRSIVTETFSTFNGTTVTSGSAVTSGFIMEIYAGSYTDASVSAGTALTLISQADVNSVLTLN